MASMGRSMNAMKAGARAAALRSRAASSSASAPPLRSSPVLRRRSGCVVSALGSVESLMPLHSAVASARLRSFIASDSSYWSCLSQCLNKRI